MGCQMENDRKSYRFLFGTFFDRGVHFEKQHIDSVRDCLAVWLTDKPCYVNFLYYV